MCILVVQILIILSPSFVASLLLDDVSCSAPNPCICLNEFVDCSSKQLSQLPSFNGNSRPSSKTHTLYVLLYNNHLAVIPDNGFNALRLTRANAINIFMYNNQIHSIGDNAFSGVEDLVQEIDLENNNLTALPLALGKLRRLQVLKIQGNYIRSMDSSVLQNIGNSLTDIHFSADYFHQWPTNLHWLQRLVKLQVDKITYTTLANDSFTGLERSLKTLIIFNSNLDSIPDAICTLQSLQVFVFNHNIHLTQSSALSSSRICIRPMTNVHTVRLTDNNFTLFPDIFNTFSNVNTVTVSGNAKLNYVPTELVSSTYNNVTELNLDNNQLRTVPHVIGKLRNLTSLSLKDNLIGVIDGDVFNHLNQLKALYLKGNPLMYLESTSLSGLTSLITLNLESTSLRAIPKAVMMLPALSSLNLNHLSLNCTCELTHRIPWPQMNNITISGQCSSGSLTLQIYVRRYLSLCK